MSNLIQELLSLREARTVQERLKIAKQQFDNRMKNAKTPNERAEAKEDYDALVAGINAKSGIKESKNYDTRKVKVDLEELIAIYVDQKNLHAVEGPKGIQNLTKIVGVLGYRSLNSFLEDNSGAIEEIIEWISNQKVPEWKEKFKEATMFSDSEEPK